MLTNMNTDFGKRLKEARKHAGLTQQQLARKVGIGQSTIAELERSGLGSSHVTAIAVACGVSPFWLADGKGSMLSEANTSPGPEMKGMYPLLSEVQAGRWTELCTGFQSSDAQDWRPSTKNLGPCGFMLRVRGRSMENPGGSPSFTEGMILHINPDIDPLPGHFVVVRRSATDETTFKRYLLIEGAPYLEAINPDWPKDEKYLKLMPGDAWCGVVVDASLGGLI